MSRPWMPLYVGDYIADTAHLTAAESGAYLHLIMHYWMKGGLPDDDRLLSRIAKMTPEQWQESRETVRAFFSDGWKHKRIEFELTEAARISTAGKIGGVASGAARREKRQKRTIVERSLNDQGNDSPTICEALQPQSQKIHGGGGEARDLAFDVCEQIAKIAGYPDATHWPPRWLQAPHRVRAFLDSGYTPEVMCTAAREAMARKKDGPPNSIAYFEQPFARARARQEQPLPVVTKLEPQKVKANAAATDGSFKSALARLRETRRSLEESAVPQGSGDALRLVSDRRGQ